MARGPSLVKSYYYYYYYYYYWCAVCDQGIQPLRMFHLGGDEVPEDALVKSPACRSLLDRYGATSADLQLHFMRTAVDIAASLGVDTVQVIWHRVAQGNRSAIKSLQVRRPTLSPPLSSFPCPFFPPFFALRSMSPWIQLEVWGAGARSTLTISIGVWDEAPAEIEIGEV